MSNGSACEQRQAAARLVAPRLTVPEDIHSDPAVVPAAISSRDIVIMCLCRENSGIQGETCPLWSEVELSQAVRLVLSFVCILLENDLVGPGN